MMQVVGEPIYINQLPPGLVAKSKWWDATLRWKKECGCEQRVAHGKTLVWDDVLETALDGSLNSLLMFEGMGYNLRLDTKYVTAPDSIPKWLVDPDQGDNEYPMKLFALGPGYATFFPASELKEWWESHPQWKERCPRFGYDLD